MCRWRRPGRTRIVIAMLQFINERLDTMATQEQVDALAARLDTVLAGIRQDIADIKAAHPEVDLSGLEARVAGLETLDAENPEPSPEPGE